MHVDGTASIKYAVDHLGTRLLVVLGHSHCGAVTAAVVHFDDPSGEPAEIVSLLDRIEPALAGLPQGPSKDARVEEAVKRNVQSAVRRLSRVPDLRHHLQEAQLKIVGAVYDMHTGEVQTLP